MLVKNEEVNKLPAHSRRQRDASVTIIENKMKELSLCSFYPSTTSNNQEAIVATDVTQKFLENRAKQKRRKALEQHINKGQQFVMESSVVSFGKTFSVNLSLIFLSDKKPSRQRV